ncbi:thiolase-like protein [Xylariaceae sp. FL0662B]|nr:thiolase-like protein [Xylariaceae sp. FL0662B]
MSDDFRQIPVERRCAATELPHDRFNIDDFWHPHCKRQNAIGLKLQGTPSRIEGVGRPSWLASVQKINMREWHLLTGDIRNVDAGFVASWRRLSYHALGNVGSPTTSSSCNSGTHKTSYLKYNVIGSAGPTLVNRIESMHVDTACSSSFVTMSLPYQILVSGKADLAVAGASNITFGPEFNVSLSNMNFLSPTSQCHNFDINGRIQSQAKLCNFDPQAGL